MPKYEVIWRGEARRVLEFEVPQKLAFAIYHFVIERLSENPQRLGKPLEGEASGLYAARVSTYRIIYKIDENEIVILIADVRHRAFVYAQNLKDLLD